MGNRSITGIVVWVYKGSVNAIAHCNTNLLYKESSLNIQEALNQFDVNYRQQFLKDICFVLNANLSKLYPKVEIKSIC